MPEPLGPRSPQKALPICKDASAYLPNRPTPLIAVPTSPAPLGPRSPKHSTVAKHLCLRTSSTRTPHPTAPLPPSNAYLAGTIGPQKPKALPIGDGHLCLPIQLTPPLLTSPPTCFHTTYLASAVGPQKPEALSVSDGEVHASHGVLQGIEPDGNREDDERGWKCDQQQGRQGLAAAIEAGDIMTCGFLTGNGSTL